MIKNSLFKILDTYSLEFLDLPNNYSELDLKHAIIGNVVEYSMSRNISPTQVSEYKLKLIDRKILENKLNEITEMLDK